MRSKRYRHCKRALATGLTGSIAVIVSERDGKIGTRYRGRVERGPANKSHNHACAWIQKTDPRICSQRSGTRICLNDGSTHPLQFSDRFTGIIDPPSNFPHHIDPSHHFLLVVGGNQ